MLEALEKIHFANVQPERRRREGWQKKRKRSTILPISMVQSFFCVFFFSLCSNLSMWPGGQIVPDESRCYIPIFDGVVFTCVSYFYGATGTFDKLWCNLTFHNREGLQLTSRSSNRFYWIQIQLNLLAECKCQLSTLSTEFTIARVH